ncbi:PQQ-binding-like beta-propeller repeat protein [Cellulomonas sp. DKR-3]|uniref:PQQ-binding-like beta-propeller repeat protein n=1 Tax=Cellulomonas fulva TaxID=2835530 RepID=A0ABS5TY73_9CELL|nr:PQQ-binding-like beta-propeller repeat protein [Cellulomonas fulva]MBT0994105.1 PQQ-binding-like beta-propeller repeat protein [Cellulomonas fulva]
MARARAMQTVELTEDGAPAGPALPAAGRHGRRAGIAGVLVVVLAGALLVGQATLDARHRADVRRIAALPGAVAPVPDEPSVRWTLDAELLEALRLETPVRLTDGSGELYVGAVARSDGSVEAVGIEATNGARRWTTTLTGTAREDVRSGAPGTGCVVAHASSDEGPVLACLLTFHHDADGPLAPPRRAQVAVFDARAGEVLARFPVPAQASRLAVVDGTAAVAWRVLGAVDLEARDLTTGALRWRTSLSVPRSGTPMFGATSGAPRVGRVQLQSAAGLLVVAAGQETYLLTADGQERGDGARQPAYVREATPGRLVLLVVDGEIGSLTVRPHAPDQVVDGAVALPTLDDGSADVVLTVDDGLRGRDPDDGRVLWRVAGRDSGLVVLDGVAYQATDRDLLRAVDVATGEVLWHVPARPGRYGTGVLTDGDRLYVEARTLFGPGGTAVLLAYGLDGLPQAEILPPPGWTSLELRGGVVVATSDDASRGAILGP